MIWLKVLTSTKTLTPSNSMSSTLLCHGAEWQISPASFSSFLPSSSSVPVCGAPSWAGVAGGTASADLSCCCCFLCSFCPALAWLVTSCSPWTRDSVTTLLLPVSSHPTCSWVPLKPLPPTTDPAGIGMLFSLECKACGVEVSFLDFDLLGEDVCDFDLVGEGVWDLARLSLLLWLSESFLGDWVLELVAVDDEAVRQFAEWDSWNWIHGCKW